jgi:hypothetical protein
MRYSAPSAFNARKRSIKSEFTSIVSSKICKVANERPNCLGATKWLHGEFPLELANFAFSGRAGYSCHHFVAARLRARLERTVHAVTFDPAR